MQDAVPIRLGQEFAAYALTLRRGVRRLQDAADGRREQNIGATAVGPGSTPSPQYIDLVVALPRRADRPPDPPRGAPGPGHPVDAADARGLGRHCAASPSTSSRSARTCG